MTARGDGADVTAVFSARVRASRGDRGWSLRDLSAVAGMTYPTLSKIENGAGTSLAGAARIARALGMPLAALLPDVACGHCLDAPPRGFTCQECDLAGPAVTGG
jgi:transcriptional regulator with XRE-family HTH domain